MHGSPPQRIAVVAIPANSLICAFIFFISCWCCFLNSIKCGLLQYVHLKSQPEKFITI